MRLSGGPYPPPIFDYHNAPSGVRIIPTVETHLARQDSP